MPLDPHLAGLLGLIAAAGHPPMSQQTPVEARRGFRALTVDLRDPASLPSVASVEDVEVPGGDGPRPARIYRPHGDGPLPTVVMFHGGGFVIGDLDTHDLLARTIARGCDAVVVSVDYRLAPEHPWPAGIEDAIAATRWAASSLPSLGGSDLVAVAGDSAGGNLAAVAAQTLRDDGVALAGQLLLYPVTDPGGDHPSHAENGTGYFLDLDTMVWFDHQYVGHLAAIDRTDPRLAPYHGDLAGLAPTVLVVAEYDPLRDDGLAYARALEAAGVRVEVRTFPGLIHGFADMGRHSPGAQAAVDETVALFRKVLHGS
ncbi:alpha/beta hydrolase fold domain-containing protein [Nocardioides sp. MAH-18]|uniref:Alpha/beta hydrolase fold domain-containing protein n=1 Tax=Nocardioides agri TaxID=2682843 RepID=A0A6L6XPF4_9ACTN|nr:MULTISPECIES: alpha/beta hydrolase [unclassified Nocardioides]MBA2954303.1 alpha/beta hydrolase [Nocardioides sp. CGMCC 1.13656]MVQ49164.1 alpha/beta hydrolase fold domain-containing protein [Nocardioides sp. MAH-18]